MNQQILLLQKAWLDKLQEQSKKPILIKALEGKIPNELRNSNASGLYCWSYYKDVFSMMQTPYFTRSILVNEIVLDPDTPVWDDLKTEMDKIVATLIKLKIPYLLAYSGGKGCHLHVFFDMNITIPKDIFDKAKENNFDIYKAFRQHVFEYIMNESKANIELLKIDKPKINWQIFSMGSQVRDFGTSRGNGFCKTLIDRVPTNRPLAPLPLLFPEKIELWKIPDEHIPSVINKIKSGIVRQIKYNKQTLPTTHGIRRTDELPCISLIMNGLDKGRYYGAGAITLAGKEIGLAWVDIEPIVELFLSRCPGLSSSDVILRLENSKHLYDSEKIFSCKWVKENLKCPRPSECIITIKRKEQKEIVSDDNDYLKIADTVFTNNNFITLMETDEILIYKDGIYEKYGENFIKSEAQRINDDINTHEVNEIVNYIKRKTYLSIRELNKHKHIVAMDGCYFNTSSQQTEEYDPATLITIKIPVKYNPSAKCPNIDKFFSDIVRADDIIAIEEFFGYCLYRDYPIQKAFMLVGGGGNGKSTLLNVLKRFLGEPNVCSVALQELEDNHFAAANLFGKLANLYADLPPQALDSTGKIKMLTGGDHITVERKFGGFFEYVNYAKMIFSTNKLPMSYDDTDAFYRRWVIINFPNVFNETNGKGLIEKLTTEDELSGLFNKAVSGLKRLFENGRFSGQKSIEQIREQYVRLSDSIQAFVMDCLESSSDGWIEKKELYKVYGAYCKNNNIPISSEKRFFLRVGFSIRTEDFRTQDSKRNRIHAFKGIVFKVDIESIYTNLNTLGMSSMSNVFCNQDIENKNNSNTTPTMSSMSSMANVFCNQDIENKNNSNTTPTMSSMSSMAPICIAPQHNILNAEKSSMNTVDEKEKTLDILTNYGLKCVTQLINEKGNEFQTTKHQNITSGNIVEFCMWFCDQTGYKHPKEIREISSKIFKLTPELIHKTNESHLSYLCKNGQCKECGGFGCECVCHGGKP